MKIDRLLSMTIMLINRPMVTARELSERFEISIRTVYRDIESISAAGIPVVSWQGKKGGFCLMDNYKVDRQLLTLNDMTSILMALKGISTTFDNGNISETIEKIESLVPDDKKAHINRYFEHIIIDLSPWDSNGKHKDLLYLIQKAINLQKLIFFSYRNLKGENISREVEPMTLILKSNYWYLYGFCRNRNDFRIFRLSRIANCQLLNLNFTPKDHPFIENDFFSNDNRKPVDLVLKFSPSAKSKVYEFYSECSISEDQNGFLTVKVSYPEDEWVYSNILSYGEECEVLEPFHIRQLIIDRLKKAARNYL